MEQILKRAKASLSYEVVARQAELNPVTAKNFSQKDALSTWQERKAVVLRPHPEVVLGDPVDWGMDPLGERNWCAQLHMLRWLRPLVKEARENGDYESSLELVRIVTSWKDAAYPQQLSPKYAWSDMIDAVRVFELLGVYLAIPRGDRPMVEDLLYSHGEWLENEKNLGHSNHAVWQHIALFVLGHAFKNEPWIAVAKERIDQAFNFEYDHQGINREAAPGYHLYNYVLWHDVDARMRAEGDEVEGIAEKLEKAREALVHFTWPDGNLIEIGDTAPRTHLKKLAGELDVDYVLSRGATGEVPNGLHKVYSAGYAIARSGWGANARNFVDEFFVSLRFGTIGVHGHNDLGSILLGADGRRLLIEGGKYAYLSDANKRHVIGRSAHNTFVVPASEEIDNVEYELLFSSTSSMVDEWVVRGVPYAGVRHTRRIVYARGADAVLIIDNVTSKKEHDYTLYWHLDPEASVVSRKRKHNVTVGPAKFTIQELGTHSDVSLVQGVEGPEMEGWFSPEWAKLEPTPTLKMVKNGARLRFMTVIASGSSDKFEAQSIPNEQNNFVFKTSKGYFHVDGSESPATVRYSRSLEFSESDESAEQSAISLSSEFGPRWEEGSDELGNALLSRLSSNESDVNNPGALVSRAVDDMFKKNRFAPGKAAALIDLLGYVYGVNDPRVRSVANSGPYFRGPIPFREMAVVSSVPIVAETVPSDDLTFYGASVTGEHALAWNARRGNRKLVVRFNGAIDRSKTSLPYFGGLNSLLERDESVIVFSDPALDRDPDLTLGWYLGETGRGKLLYDHINAVIDFYVKRWDIEDVILFGTSGGGFAALQVGLRRGKCKILPMNPQTVLSHYFTSFYERGRDSAAKDGALFAEKFPSAFDTRMLLSQLKDGTVVHYVDNSVGDKHHHNKHYLPFAEAARKYSVQLRHIEVDLGVGHRQVGREMTSKLLDEITGSNK